jgi:hypothetical protein
VELRKRGVPTVMVVTDAFLPLALAQVTVRGQELEMIVVTHPVGGLQPDELANRVTEAVGQLEAGTTTS